jgi:hypothetical protein
VNCSSLGIINLTPLAAILNLFHLVNALISINDCSKEVSFKSAAVASSFLNEPAIVG